MTHLAFESRHEERPQTFANTQVELLRSPIVLEPVVRTPQAAAFFASHPELAPIPWLTKQLGISAVGQSELYKVSLKTVDPDISAHIVNAVLDSYFTLRGQDETERVERMIRLLEEERERRARDVASLGSAVEALGKNSPAKKGDAGSSQAGATPVTALAEIQGRLITMEVETEMLRAKIRAAEEAKPAAKAPAQAVATGPEATEIKKAIAEKRTKLAEIENRSVLGRNEPSYQRLEAELRIDQQKLAELSRQQAPAEVQERPGSIAALRSELEGRLSAAKLLRDRYTAQVKQIEQLDRPTPEHVELDAKRAELERAEKVLEQISERLATLRTEQRAPGRVSLMRRAEVPIAPLEKLPLKLIALAVLAGLGLPVAAAVAWELRAKRINDAQSFGERSSVTVLAEVPRLSPQVIAATFADPAEGSPQVQAFHESFDILRTSMVLSDNSGDVKILAVTSAIPHEGKTSVSIELAKSIARATGEPSLLIDGDMRLPDVHRRLRVPQDPGLAQVLAGQCSSAEAIFPAANGEIHVMPAGRLVVNPHLLLNNGRLDALLAELRGRYRNIVVDTPPVLLVGETLALAKAADACLVCVMRDVSRSDQFEKARQRLEAAGCRVAGAVLSGVPWSHVTYHYGNYSYGSL